MIGFPEVSVSRGGVRFPDFSKRDPAALAAADAMNAFITRRLDEMNEWRNTVLDRACQIALVNGWDVHVYYHPDAGWKNRHDLNTYAITQRIGIRYSPAKYPLPTIHEHHGVDATNDDDEDWARPD